MENSQIQPSNEIRSTDSITEDHVNVESSRPLYGLFVLPVLIISIGICVGYIRHFMLHRVRNIIRMVDDYMISNDDDPDQTPVKVLDIQDALSTFDYDSTDELAWDDSIERNAQDIVNKLEESKDDSNSSLIIDVNLDDYLKLFPKIPDQIHSTPKSKKNTKDEEREQTKTSSSLARSRSTPSPSRENRFETGPDHFPSFNISISDSSDENFDENDSKKSQSDISKESDILTEMKEVSRTRSGKRYK